MPPRTSCRRCSALRRASSSRTASSSSARGRRSTFASSTGRGRGRCFSASWPSEGGSLVPQRNAIRLIKRYGTGKLSDTLETRYITLEEIPRLVRGGSDVKVIDNDNGADLT